MGASLSPGTAATPYVAPVGIDANLAAFTNLLGGKGSGGAIDDYFNEASRLRGIGNADSDPAFAEYMRTQGNNLAAEQKATTAQQAEFFNRRGMGDSSVAMNQANRTAASFDLKRDSLASSIGLMGMQRRDDSFASAMNAEGTGLGLASKPAELAISELAAQNAGKVPDPPNNGNTSGINSWGKWLSDGPIGQVFNSIGSSSLDPSNW